MRFRVLLPVLQTLSMLLIVWAPWNSRAHRIDIVLRNGREITAWTLLPGPNALDWAEGIDLPAAAVVTPVEFAIRRADALPNDKVRFFGFWIVGLLCWYMVGRCVDDVLLWRRGGVLPRKHPGDVAFALIAVPSALLLADRFHLRWHAWCSLSMERDLACSNVCRFAVSAAADHSTKTQAHLFVIAIG